MKEVKQFQRKNQYLLSKKINTLLPLRTKDWTS